jgi:divalent metal cation (Fe/Co/Zn/Cd) transporter
VSFDVEHAIRDELGPQIEVESHIEPLAVAQLEGREADAATVAKIAATLAQTATGVDGLSDVHNVRVRATESGLIVNYHCRADPGLNVALVHEMTDELERRVRLAHPEILRIVGHAEPIRH